MVYKVKKEKRIPKKYLFTEPKFKTISDRELYKEGKKLRRLADMKAHFTEGKKPSQSMVSLYPKFLPSAFGDVGIASRIAITPLTKGRYEVVFRGKQFHKHPKLVKYLEKNKRKYKIVVWKEKPFEWIEGKVE